MPFKERLLQGRVTFTELMEYFEAIDKPSAHNQFDVDGNTVLRYLNGVDETIDKQMIIRFSRHDWTQDDRDNIHQNDAKKWVKSPFYERVILFLSLGQVIQLDETQRLAAGHLLAKYLNTLSENEQEMIMTKIISKNHIRKGIMTACKENLGLTAAVGLAIVRLYNSSRYVSGEEFSNEIADILTQDDTDKCAKVIFIVRAVYEIKFSLEKYSYKAICPLLASLIQQMGKETDHVMSKELGKSEFDAAGTKLLRILFTLLGNAPEDFDAAVLCYQDNYQRILGEKIDDYKTILTYFFMGGKIDAKKRENVPGTNGLVFTVKSHDLKTALDKGSKKLAKLLLLAGANIDSISKHELPKLCSKELNSPEYVLNEKESRLEHLLRHFNESDEAEIIELLELNVSAKHISLTTLFELEIFPKTYHFSLLGQLIDAGVVTNNNIIMIALEYGYAYAICILSKKLNIDVNSKNARDVPLIMLAVIKQDLASVQALINARANINVEFNGEIRVLVGDSQNSLAGKLGFSDSKIRPIHIAIDSGNLNIVRLLLEQGSNDEGVSFSSYDPSIRPFTPLEFAKMCKEKDGSSSHVQICKFLTFWAQMKEMIIQELTARDYFIVVLDLFIKHYEPSMKFSFKKLSNEDFPAITKTNVLRTTVLNETNPKTLLNIIIAQAMSYSKQQLDVDEKNLLATLNFLIENSPDKFKSEISSTPNTRNGQGTELKKIFMN